MRNASVLILSIFFLTAAAEAAPADATQLQAAHATVLASSKSATTINFEVPDLASTKIEESGESRTVFPLDGEGAVLQQGMPLLPLLSRYVAVPPEANLELNVIEGDSYIETATEPPLMTNIDSLSNTGGIQTTGIFPPVVAEMSDPFIIRGVRFVRVIVFPVQYDFDNKIFIHHPSVQTEVRSIAGDPVNPLRGWQGAGRSEAFRRFVEDFAVNGSEFLRDDADYSEEPDYLGHYLVATNSNCLPYMVPFIEWRRKAGYKMDILSLPDGNEARNAGTIEQRIQARWDDYVNNHQEPFEYLLLVGDREGYSYAPGVGWVLQSPVGTTTWAQEEHGEYLYANLSGNDDNPDVAWGRYPGGSRATLELMVGRTLAYEANPSMQDTTWFTRGGAYSQHWGNSNESAWHISIHTNVRWGEEVLQSRGFDDVGFYEFYDWDQYGHRLAEFLVPRINAPSNVLIGRAENYHFTNRDGGNQNFDQAIRANFAFPVNLATSGHGEWGAEIMFRTGDGAHLKGYVNTTFCWAGPMTMAESAIWLDLVHGVMQKDLPIGWGFNYAMNHFESYFPQGTNWAGMQIGPLARTDNNHFGDPGLKVWMGVPKLVEMEYPETIPPETRLVEVAVHAPNGGDPVPNARVTFYAPGDIPLGNMDNYKNYTDLFTRNTHTDENGIARLVVPEGVSLAGDTLYITVTGDKIKPFFGKSVIRAPQAAVALGQWSISEVAGNGDEAVNPGEQFALTIPALNLGAGDATDVSALVTSLSPFVTVGEDNTVFYGDIAGNQTGDGDRTIPITVSPSCPDAIARPGAAPVLAIDFNSGDQTWRSALTLQSVAPRLAFAQVRGGSNMVPDSVATIDVQITNRGQIGSGALRATLREIGTGVTVIDGESSYPSIAPGRAEYLDGRRFQISGNKVVVPGSLSKMMLILTSDAGFVDTTYFDLQVMRPRVGAPIGPDPYGYICFDDSDTAWDVAPEYEWVEINPAGDNADFEGTQLGFRGQSPNDVGEAIVVPLPFTTQFYGVDYDSITVATNGFVSMGNQPRITNYQNWPMDNAIGGGVGMLAPFWDDLRLAANTSGIFTYYDSTDSRFIIEWYRMRPANGNAEQTFQAIIYDKSVWITLSGDPNVLFQYKTITNLENIRNGDQAFISGTPYASVGISGPHGEGLNYTYRNAYPTGAATLQARRAILFTTATEFRSCILYGTVTDAATGMAVPGATVFTKHGFVATTDDAGYWRIGKALAGVPFDVTSRKQGYNDSTLTDIQVEENDSLQIDFNLLHPEFSPTTWQITSMLDPDRSEVIPFSLTNTGNGPLTWSAQKRLYGDANAAPWELRRAYNAGTITDDDRIEGVVFANDRFYFSGANGTDSSMIYIVDREGALLDSFPQPTHSRYGMKDIEWDGQYLWGAGDSIVTAFNTLGEVAYQWRGPFNPTNNLAWDSNRGILWVAGTTTNIVGCDIDGNHVDTLARKGLRIYGLSYWPDDPDGYNLYITTYPGGTPAPPPRIYKMNTETGDTIRVESIPVPAGTTGIGGGFITNQFDVYSWVFMTVANIPPASGSDRLQIFQLDARRDWFGIDQWSGMLQTGETQDFNFTFNSAGLPDTLFQGEILFTHNADSSRGHLDVSLDVIGERAPSPFLLLDPPNGDTLKALPLHGDTLHLPVTTFAWSPSRDPNFDDTLVTYTIHFQTGETVVSKLASDTSFTVNLDTLGLSLWFNSQVAWWVESRSGDQTAECLSRFYLTIIPDAADPDAKLPVEFALRSIYPSPFNGRASISFGIDRAIRTTLVAYDLSGREAARIFDGVPVVGYHQVTWNADQLPSGIYMLKLESAGRARVAKVALVK